MSLSRANLSTCVRRKTRSLARTVSIVKMTAQPRWNHELMPMQQMGSPSLNFWLHAGRLQVVMLLARITLRVG